MDIDRQTIVEIVVAVIPVFGLASAIYVIGTSYTQGEALTPDGGLYIVVGLVAFIFVMAGVGYWLASTDFEEGEPNGS